MSQAAASNRIYEPKSPLNRLLSEAPFKARCSDNKTASLVRPKEFAMRYPYMQVNRKDMVSWLVFDLDHSNPFIWEDENLPQPNMVVINRNNGHSHLYYALAPVCTSEKALSRPIQYMKAVYEAMAIRLKADLAYSGPVAKTPGHPWWSTMELHTHEYDLGMLSDSVTLEVKPFWNNGPNLDLVSHSRHCTLFEEVRFYAYSIVNKLRQESSYNDFVAQLDRYAMRKNNYKDRGFASNLSISEVRATVKSIARWTWDRYTGSSKSNRGVMGLPSSLSTNEKQKKSAKRTHEMRKTRTKEKISLALKELKKSGLEATYTSISAMTKLSRQTVSKYMKELSEKAEPKVLHLANLFRKNKNVKNGVHQITAPCKGNDCREATPLNSWRPFRSHKSEGLLFRPAQRPLGRFLYIFQSSLIDYGDLSCYALGRSER